jgi:thioredoxin-dependent peroxiredoxin
VGVSFDQPGDNSQFAEKFDFNFPLLCDTDKEVGLAYGACDSTAATNAKRVGVVIDPEGNIQEYSPKVDAASYAEQVLARI